MDKPSPSAQSSAEPPDTWLGSGHVLDNERELIEMLRRLDRNRQEIVLNLTYQLLGLKGR